MRLTVSLVVEGHSDEVVVKRLLREEGIDVGWVYGLRGKPWLDKHVRGYNRAAEHAHWLVVRDLDHDADCVWRG